MRIATFKFKDETDGAPRLGLVAGDSILALTAPSGRGAADADADRADMISLIRSFPDGRARLDEMAGRVESRDGLPGGRVGLDRVKLCAPIERPGKLVCLAGNYRAHITESGYVAPEQTDVITQQLFLKPSTCITGDGEDIIIGRDNVSVGWETELAVVIGKRGRDIDARDAYTHVFGYTILNDVSERRLNSRLENRHKRELDTFFDWLAGKWFDSFAPCGPWIVTADEIGDPHDLDIRLNINGQLRQQGNTRDMIFSIPEQIAYASTIMTLEPGDIISTGTPAGAGVGGDTSLHDGDELVCEIEKVGKLRNTVRCAN
jgi:2-keto-4-pentenoate hydratase/2-oxohepta-3-ene-1,7-dioic acid hydratase in catechol pathway